MDIFAGLSDEFTRSFVAFSPSVAVLRLTMAIALGGMLGLERKWHERNAPLRLHMLISLAACLFALVAFEIAAEEGLSSNNTTLRADPLRLVAAITSGVGFLAAGSVLNPRAGVHGLTTGASMWLAGAVGLTCGVGALTLALLTTALALLVLLIVRRIAIITGIEERRRDDRPPGGAGNGPRE